MRWVVLRLKPSLKTSRSSSGFMDKKSKCTVRSIRAVVAVRFYELIMFIVIYLFYIKQKIMIFLKFISAILCQN
jgi:hypothetical protein